MAVVAVEAPLAPVRPIATVLAVPPIRAVIAILPIETTRAVAVEIAFLPVLARWPVEALAVVLAAAFAVLSLGTMAVHAVVLVFALRLAALEAGFFLALLLELVGIFDEGAIRLEGMPELLGHLLLRREQDAIIMLGVLEVVLSRYRVARGLGVASELQVLLGDMLRRAADLDVRTIRLVAPLQRVRRFPVAIIVVVIVVAAAHAPVLTWSHSRLSRVVFIRSNLEVVMHVV